MDSSFWNTFLEISGTAAAIAAIFAIIGTLIAVGIWAQKINGDRHMLEREMVRFWEEMDRFQTDFKQSIRDSKYEIKQDMRDFKREIKQDMRDFEKAFNEELKNMQERLPNPPTV